MTRNRSRFGESLGEFISYVTSHRFAVTVISILFVASCLGWILTELIPADISYNAAVYEQKWGHAAVTLITALKLDDPFHSAWYSGVLALFWFVLLLCIVSRWKRFILRSFRTAPPATAGRLDGREFRFEILWSHKRNGGRSPRDPLTVLERKYGRDETIDTGRVRLIAGRVADLFRKKRFHVTSEEHDGTVLFAAVSGRWRFIGSLLFHCGILVIAVGGIIGSVWGFTEVQFGRRGDMLSLHGSRYTLRVDDFRIILTRRNEIKDYISEVTVLDAAGGEVRTGVIEVNHPMRVAGYTIYQSSYSVDEKEFEWAKLEVSGGSAARVVHVMVRPGEPVSLPGTESALRVKRFVPDFRRSGGRIFSASAMMRNPALEVEVTGGELNGTGWLFLLLPRFNSLKNIPFDIGIVDIEPVYHTGLQISTNPGSTVLLAGIAAATVGLILLYGFNYRLIHGAVSGERIVVAGVDYRWKNSFGKEFGGFESACDTMLTAIFEKGWEGE